MNAPIFGQYDFLVWQSLILVVAALGVYLMFRAGLFAVPQAGLLAVGAYTTGLMAIHLPTPFAINVLAGTAAGMIAGGALGLALARLNGIQLAIATVAFNQIVTLVAQNQTFTGGPDGLTGIPLATPDWLVIAVLALAVAFCWRLNVTRFGIAMDALRGDTVLASHSGVSVFRYRLAIFGVCGLLCGLAGALLAQWIGFIDPNQYSFDGEVQLLSMAILGGMASYWGPLLGAVVVMGGPQVLTDLQQYRYVFDGILIVLVIAFVPGGVAALPATVLRLMGRRPKLVGTQPAPPSSAVLLPARAERNRSSTEVALEVTSVSKRFGGLQALDSVDLVVRFGEIVGIIGPNGSGKTTLLNVISGALTPESGAIQIVGVAKQSMLGHPNRMAAAGIARSFQGIRLLPELTVLDNVWLGAYTTQRTSLISQLLPIPSGRRERLASRDRAREMLRAIGLEGAADRYPNELAYGHQRLVEIIRAVMASPVVLLLDEPSAGMTTLEKRELMHLLQQLCAQGLAVVLVEHDLGLMTSYCDWLVVLNFGRRIAGGKPGDVMSTEEVLTAYVGRTAQAN